jgi:hypothetical protein
MNWRFIVLLGFALVFALTGFASPLETYAAWAQLAFFVALVSAVAVLVFDRSTPV